MLTITTGGEDYYDELENEFLKGPTFSFEIEHSLVSLSKWESKYEIPFLGDETKTDEQLLDYVRFMIVTPNFDDKILEHLGAREAAEIHAYINSAQTATTFGGPPEQRGRPEKITAELIYFWMTQNNVPWEAQTWHLNRLLTLIRICHVKQQKQKKRTPMEIATWQREENARRLKAMGTTG